MDDKHYNVNDILKIAREHKLFNYVIRNRKCAKMYHLTDEEIEKLERFMYYGKKL